MLHSRMFTDTPKYRENHFEPLRTPLPSPPDTYHQSQISSSELYLDGNPAIDRPLIVQFCSNSPEDLLKAAQYVAPFCDAVDLNLGCPQGIAKKGKYGAFLQEDQDLIFRLINTLHKGLSVPVTAKMRILDTRERTLDYAKLLLSAGASIITVHGRQRDQKGHKTGLADWTVLRYLREQLPPDTVIFANGNILQHGDIAECLEATGADGVMSAEGNLYDPSIFATPPLVGEEGREYWRGRDWRGGYRMDAALRRYMDIIYKYVLEVPVPQRKPLFLPSDLVEPSTDNNEEHTFQELGPPKKRQKIRQENKGRPKNQPEKSSTNLTVMQSHLFHMLRPLVAKHTNIRDALAKSRAGVIEHFENVLQMVEVAVKEGLTEYEQDSKQIASTNGNGHVLSSSPSTVTTNGDMTLSSDAAVARCKRPWFICQPYVRPLPTEALEKGALTLSKKEKARLQEEERQTREAGLMPEGRVQAEQLGTEPETKVEIPKEGMVCG